LLERTGDEPRRFVRMAPDGSRLDSRPLPLLATGERAAMAPSPTGFLVVYHEFVLEMRQRYQLRAAGLDPMGNVIATDAPFLPSEFGRLWPAVARAGDRDLVAWVDLGSGTGTEAVGLARVDRHGVVLDPA